MEETTNLNFESALSAMKAGARVARDGWNGKGMWVCLTPGGENLPASSFWAPPNKAFAESQGGTATVRPSFTLKGADNTISFWVPSGSDILAEDWEILD